MIAVGSVAGHAWAANKTFQGPSGDNWSTTHWWIGGLPVNGDNAYVTTTTSSKTLNFDGSYSAGRARSICGIDSTSSSATMTLSQATTSDMCAATEYVGYSGNGVYSQSTGTNTSTGDTYVGYSGQGIYSQSGGMDTISGNIYVGFNSGSNGSYLLSGDGSLSISGSEYIGCTYNAVGSITQTGGTHTVESGLVLGNAPGSTGTYTLGSNSSLFVNRAEDVGYTGTAMFIQNGGTHTVNSDLLIGQAVGSIGTYSLSDGAELSVVGEEYIGSSGQRAFVQSGRAHTVGSALFIGASGKGSYTLNGNGTLFVSSIEYVGWLGSIALPRAAVSIRRLRSLLA